MDHHFEDQTWSGTQENEQFQPNREQTFWQPVTCHVYGQAGKTGKDLSFSKFQWRTCHVLPMFGSNWGGPKKTFRRDCQCALLWNATEKAENTTGKLEGDGPETHPLDVLVALFQCIKDCPYFASQQSTSHNCKKSGLDSDNCVRCFAWKQDMNIVQTHQNNTPQSSWICDQFWSYVYFMFKHIADWIERLHGPPQNADERAESKTALYHIFPQHRERRKKWGGRRRKGEEREKRKKREETGTQATTSTSSLQRIVLNGFRKRWFENPTAHKVPQA